MSQSSFVNFSRRYGKSIGDNRLSTYKLNKELEQTISDEDKRKLFNNYLPEIFKYDLFLCEWLYYDSYDEFILEFKEYVLTLNDDEFNLAVNSSIHLKTIVELFWMEKNDPKLKEEYTYETSLEEYKKAVEKNNYKFDEENTKYDGFKLTLKQLDYTRRNETLYDELFKLTKQLSNARFDDVLQMRTEEEWKILYSLRYLYKDVVNKILTGTNTPDSDLHKSKRNLEDYLMLYQQSTEGLDWHNPYSDKLIVNIEYFPRETSKPPHDYAYAKYHNLEENASTNVNNMIDKRKRKREEYNNELAERLNKLKKLMEDRNNRIKRIAKYLNYGIISVVIGVSAVMCYYFM